MEMHWYRPQHDLGLVQPFPGRCHTSHRQVAWRFVSQHHERDSPIDIVQYNVGPSSYEMVYKLH